MYSLTTKAAVIAVLGAAMGCDGATARLALANQTTGANARGAALLADGTSLRLKMIAVYLAEDVDPVTMNNVGATEMIWLNPQCQDDISGCNIEGFTQPPGPRVTDYFDLARSTAEVNAELNSQGASVSPGTYRYARVELCKSYGDERMAAAPTLMWAGPGMASEQPFTSGDCGRTSVPFDPPLSLAAGDAVEVTLGYDLGAAIVAGPPGSAQGCSFSIAGHVDPSGSPHCFRACVDVDASSRVCMDFPDFAPSAAKLPAGGLFGDAPSEILNRHVCPFTGSAG
ncbi:MAG TPA: hypothetical protein VFK02_24440 [Kofleriaceae bacterium]|nr:hypothetical protein [Kofleriaceae bacterium]